MKTNIFIYQYGRSFAKIDKALMFLWNKVFCLKNIKFWQTPTTIEFNIFCWNFAHVSYLSISRKACSGFLKFCLDLELFAKIKKDLVSAYSIFTFLLITQDLNKIEKIPEHPFCRHC